ncbi:hypothetical protein C5167_045599 [Papaver somniferum]|uniref:Serine hydroxymethyltransferase-like domain-containing protein n=1 Tax=Papaver somniferum TaxID=3469 RepID=A0A4Y7LDP7_PAPSO|nr:hypothetical protein C5167_045599 [Papaver somniferum]
MMQAITLEYKAYQEHVLKNCSQFVETLNALGYDLVSGGTENHLLVLVNLKNKHVQQLDGTANKTTVPGGCDYHGSWWRLNWKPCSDYWIVRHPDHVRKNKNQLVRLVLPGLLDS